ncbi:hypothetical protein MTR67_032843, partial [Solanum verrucosum]
AKSHSSQHLGGLGIKDLAIRSKCMLMKWHWRFIQKEAEMLTLVGAEWKLEIHQKNLDHDPKRNKRFFDGVSTPICKLKVSCLVNLISWANSFPVNNLDHYLNFVIYLAL